MEVVVRRFMIGRAICGSLLFVLFLIPSLQSQQLATGSIGGTVTDPAGRAVANIAVTLTNASQGTERVFTTKDDGVFSFATLEAANYSLSAAGGSGFAQWREGVRLEVGQSQNVIIRLAVA